MRAKEIPKTFFCMYFGILVLLFYLHGEVSHLALPGYGSALMYHYSRYTEKNIFQVTNEILHDC